MCFAYSCYKRKNISHVSRRTLMLKQGQKTAIDNETTE